MTAITLSTGEPIVFKNIAARKFRGTRLPGADLLQSELPDLKISIHQYAQRLFRFSLINIHSRIRQSIMIQETSKYLRLETIISGQLRLQEMDAHPIDLISGQYRISDCNRYQCTMPADSDHIFFIAFISPELLLQTPLAESMGLTKVQMMSGPMREVIYKILDNPFEAEFRDAFYDHSIRELLFYHLSAPQILPPGELSMTEMAAVYEADSIIASDLGTHYSIHELARMTRTNAHVLKTGFAKQFGMGTFERLLQRKMERAKYLLEATDSQIQEISDMAGYETVTGFINAFRKQFKMTPKDWRKKQRGLL